jgi:cold shock CspA family protein
MPMRGELLWFNETKNHGFIRTEDDERLYVDRDGFAPGQAPVGRCAGLKVTFERLEDGGPENTPRAVNVTLDEDVPGRRARRRHQSSVRS